jgi:spore coat polysaccharide biosynthesis protein SpsF
VVRGEDGDVLSRYMRVLEAHPGDPVVRVTADNPLTDPGLLDAMVGMLADQHFDYVHAPEAPYGAAVDVFSLAALRRCHEDGKSTRQREHINAHILDNSGSFRIGVFKPPPELRRPDLRLTVDAPEDLERLRGLLSGLADPLNVPITEVIRIADEKSA